MTSPPNSTVNSTNRNYNKLSFNPKYKPLCSPPYHPTPHPSQCTIASSYHTPNPNPNHQHLLSRPPQAIQRCRPALACSFILRIGWTPLRFLGIHWVLRWGSLGLSRMCRKRTSIRLVDVFLLLLFFRHGISLNIPLSEFELCGWVLDALVQSLLHRVRDAFWSHGRYMSQ